MSKFIVFDGMDFSGKTTLLKAACKWMDSQGIEYITTREPGATPAAQACRKILLDPATGADIDQNVQVMLFMAARLDNINRVIRPALDAGKVVISDRYYMSSLVFQNEVTDLTFELIKRFSMPKYDAWIMPEISLQETRRRLQNGREVNHLDMEFTKHFQKYKAIYSKYADQSDFKCRRINGEQSPEDCEKQLHLILEGIFSTPSSISLTA